MTNDEMISAFENFLSIERGLSEPTITAYLSDIRQFLRISNADLLSATRKDIRGYLQWLLFNKRSGSSACRKLSSLRMLFQFAQSDRLIEEDPTTHVRSPKRWKRQPRYVTASEVSRMLEEAAKEGEALALRTRVLIVLLAHAGLRISEALRLTVGDVSLSEGFVRVLSGKGDKDRIAPLTDEAIRLIAEYLANGWPSLAGTNAASDFLLIKHGGQRFSRQNAFIKIQELGERALGRKLSPHAFRHGFITDGLERGLGLRTMQGFAGHSSIDITAGYVHLSFKALFDGYLRFHPRAQFGAFSPVTP